MMMMMMLLLQASWNMRMANAFHTASTWQDRPTSLVALGAAEESSMTPSTMPLTISDGHTSTVSDDCGGDAATTTSDVTVMTELTSNTSSMESLSVEATTRRGALSLVRRYRVTLLSWVVLASTAWGTSSMALSASALRLRRNILAGSVIFTVGDMGAQALTFWTIRRRQQQATTKAIVSAFCLDQQRLVISTILGALWAGVCTPYIYDAVERFLPGHGSVGRVLLKMALSCSFLSTAGNYITMFFRRFVSKMCNLVSEQWQTAKSVLNDSTTTDLPVQSSSSSAIAGSTAARRWWPQVRQSWTQCVTSCNRDFYEVLVDDLKVWPLYDILCYAVIPPFIRPITTAFMASVWSMYMSIASAAVPKGEENEA